MTMEILTGILVAITGIYAFLTYKMTVTSEKSVQIMLEQTEAMSRPYIIIKPYVRPNTPFLYIKITNPGKTAAKNLKLKLDKKFLQFNESDKNLQLANAFQEPIQSFSPEQEVLFALGQGWLIFGDGNDDMPQQFTIDSEYDLLDGKTVKESHIIDLKPFSQSEAAKDTIVEELEKIRKALEKIAKA